MNIVIDKNTEKLLINPDNLDINIKENINLSLFIMFSEGNKEKLNHNFFIHKNSSLTLNLIYFGKEKNNLKLISKISPSSDISITSC